jgi:hypothetical protein
MNVSNRKFVLARKSSFMVGVGAIAVFAVFAALKQPQRGLIAAFSFAVIVMGAGTRWDLRRKLWYWVTILAICLLHMLFILKFKLPKMAYPTIILVPFAVVDFVAVVFSIFFAEKLAEKGRS